MTIEFHKYVDSWSALKKYGLRQHFQDREQWWEFQKSVAEDAGSPFTYRRVVLEEAWIGKERPYYNVYPAVLPMLMKLRLDIPCSSIDLSSIGFLEVRLPRGQGPEDPFRWGDGHSVHTVLFGLQDMPREKGSEELIPGLCACYDVGETDELGDPVYSFRLFPLRDDKTIEEALSLFSVHESHNVGLIVPEEIALNVVKLCVCLSLLDNDPSIICPDVLAKDADKWEKASEEDRARMLSMAHRRGKVGWNVGASIECIPHYRRPHPALVRVGKGRTLSRIVMRKGSVVHRTKLTEVPSGYEGSSS